MNKIGTILTELLKDKDLYGQTRIDLLLGQLRLKKGKHYLREIRYIKRLQKLSNEIDFTKIQDSICIKMIESVEVCRLIMIRLLTTH